MRRSLLVSIVLTAAVSAVIPSRLMAQAEAELPILIRHQIVGLFSVERIPDLKAAMEEVPGIEFVDVDFATAEATFRYDPAVQFPGAKPDQVIQRLDQMLRQASNHTFGVKPLRTIPLEKLKRVEIAVGGLDCKACSFGAYEAVWRLPGVETATASFKLGKVTALIDPEKIDQTELEMALKQRGVEIRKP